MNRSLVQHRLKQSILPFTLLGAILFGASGWNLLGLSPARSQTETRLIINSNADTIDPDNYLTLREAIHLLNGTRTMDQLSPAEKQQITGSLQTKATTIAFDLPSDRPTILLQDMLPAIARAHVTIDGTSQPGYREMPVVTPIATIATPVVTIAPAPDRQVLRGLTLTADQITVRGLALQGFTGKHQATAPLPPADIFITRSEQPNAKIPEYIFIDRNWLGRSPDSSITQQSAFGLVIYHGKGTVIHDNQISNHDGSAILTGDYAEFMNIRGNTIESNGRAGMPDAIRLEGNINGSEIHQNKILNNAGSGIYFSKLKEKSCFIIMS